MRHIVLLRHAKAVVSSADGDFARELAPRGRRQAPQIGKWLARRHAPRLVVASSARRTRETADLIVAELGPGVARRDEKALYNADESEILDVAREAPDDVACLMLVGHNPGIAELALRLAGRGDPRARAALLSGFPTCACAVFAFHGDHWRDLDAQAMEIIDFTTPKLLDATQPDD